MEKGSCEEIQELGDLLRRQLDVQQGLVKSEVASCLKNETFDLRDSGPEGAGELLRSEFHCTDGAAATASLFHPSTENLPEERRAEADPDSLGP